MTVHFSRTSPVTASFVDAKVRSCRAPQRIEPSAGAAGGGGGGGGVDVNVARVELTRR